MTFLQKIRSLKDYEVIELMIEAIENPEIQLEFTRYRNQQYDDKDKIVCTACAAVNMLYKLTNKPKAIPFGYTREFDRKRLKISLHNITFFERAIDALRRGDIPDYNFYASNLQMVRLNIDKNFDLPYLEQSKWKHNIKVYKNYAQLLKSKHETNDILAEN